MIKVSQVGQPVLGTFRENAARDSRVNCGRFIVVMHRLQGVQLQGVPLLEKEGTVHKKVPR